MSISFQTVPFIESGLGKISILPDLCKRFNIKKPIIAIGGIDNVNYARLIKNGANYIAISSYIWDNPKLKPDAAIREFK